jgi:type I restriction enzyme S subunit
MEGWKSYTLNEVCSLITDGKHGDCENETNSGYFFLSAKDVVEGFLKYENARQITYKDFLEIHRRTNLEPNDILISNSGTIGRMAVAREIQQTRRTTFQKSVAILKPIKKLIHPFFLYYNLLSQTDEIKNIAGGTTQQNLLLGDIKRFQIIIPPLPLQHRIAEILGALDDKIELNRQMNHTLEQMAQALYKHYFVDGIDPENLPEGWRNGTIGDLCFVQNGFAFKSSSFQNQGDARIIKITNIENNAVEIEKTQFVPFDIANTIDKKFHILSGNFLIAMTGAEVGKVGIVPVHEETILLNQRVGSLKDTIKYGAVISYVLLATNKMQDKLLDTAVGSAQPNISSSDIENIVTIIPSSNVIEFLGSKLHLFCSQTSQNLSENLMLKNIRDILLPKLISGEIIPSDLQTIEQAL